ncbi:MAG: 2-isopropylmalate synthase [Casimicrobiaceae bacterium]|nr:2-isopropylmalate synthase [Casimicrobiaceae bacterium]MCX8099341.1 2-isopropylmalate synthase [Casimicrobiaceae bacterium]MDW8313082.1 2-isopropylmalate synthase [Burkholderiales bacterium]
MLKDPSRKYTPYRPFAFPERTWPDKTLTRAPIWLATDLRDGNQALIEPMNVERKRRMFALNVKVGIREIEVGFPSASQTDFDFVRTLIEENLIPDDVWIQVLAPARAAFIERTFEALRGVKRAIFHLYHATAPIMREVVFGMNEDQVIEQLTIPHVRLVKRLMAEHPETEWRFEFSPEMFSSTEMDFAKRVIDIVVEEYGATADNKIIINCPTTVENLTPNCFADQIEWLSRNVKKREAIILSVHPHNDRGTGTAAAELAMMAGAERVEGCLFGNGERTGNVDLVTLALNLYSQGVSPGLDFSDIDEVRRTVEYCNQLPVHPRHPYVGDLVYTSFSGSHQDAIKKAFARREQELARDPEAKWNMPYLPIDPRDVGRSYEAVIRVNSQSGKGGISYLLLTEYGIDLPRRLQIEFSQVVQKVMDDTGKEMTADDIWNIFDAEYLSRHSPYRYVSHRLLEDSTRPDAVEVAAEVRIDGELHRLRGVGNGPIDAFVAGLAEEIHAPVKVLDYHEHSIGQGANATAITYIEMRVGDGQTLHGVGMDSNIVTASFKAILSGLNRDFAMRREAQAVKQAS